MQNELLVDSINKSYNNKSILKDIYLKINTGNIVGLFGRNGCGKSTLLKIIFGTLNAESKFIKINGIVYNNEAFKRKDIKLLPQNEFLPKYLKVSDIIKIYCKKNNVDSIINDKIIERIYKIKIRNLSGGELRYLEIKLLLNMESKFILLDEPFNGVSPILIDEIKKIIIEKSKSNGIILTDHDYRNVLSVANKIYLMKNGSIKEMKNIEEIKEYGYIPS
ncbi:ABC transporter ATP-binding protein [Spirochaetia bacterium]|nr:ABC transporter ATP-binding protein [Spirochaetia bacterium]